MSMLFSSSSSRRHLLLHLRLLSSFATPLPVLQGISISQAKARLRSDQDPDKALAIISSVSDRLTDPVSSRYVLDLAVRRLAKSGRFSDIKTLIESQKSNPNFTQEPLISTLIIAYGRAGLPSGAIHTFRDMDRLGTSRSVVSFNALLTAWCEAKKFNQVPKLFAQTTKDYGIAPDKVSYGILIKSLCQLGRLEKAISILNEMGEKGIGVTTPAYTTILDSLYKKRKVEDAERIWNEMREKGCLPDVAAYNVKIMHAAFHEKPEQVLKLIDEMASSGLKPDTISYNFLMTCYCKDGRMDDAMKVYLGLQEKGCKPNVATFRTLVHYLCENGDFDAGLEVFKASALKRKVPDFGTTKSLLEGLVKTSNLKEAEKLIEYVKKRFPERYLNAWKKVEMELGFTDEGKGSAQEPA
ncbi:pentatricopeptide repeat-containing protein, mitochondrial-like protein [Cinnamomum micranthum f. kanehirae]|uniref:Pentatricopeptide repeat-containing protein, mitochondrial-like protein n=1 Tax=Cinnamomum micranthum f. kanehirae TaxID=337451 RepID=A0A3S3N8U1_9MAGN|nr:pentatricopeptide repeat-containing protein, mitochondrial-like protein [Cinnamomum micranthum f. kanehirae]